MKSPGRLWKRMVVGGCIIIGAWTVPATAAETTMIAVQRLESAYSFTDTLQKLKVALEGSGFTIFAFIDQREAAHSVGLDLPPTTLVIYGNPRGGTPLMLAAPDFGIELPLKVLVREDPGGRVLVVYTPARALEGRHGLPAGLAAKLAGAEPLMATAIGAPAD